jgi:hypothetical protein
VKASIAETADHKIGLMSAQAMIFHLANGTFHRGGILTILLLKKCQNKKSKL